jgi:hypothetical protein
MQPIADYNVFFDSAKKALDESAAIREELKQARDGRTELEDQLQTAQDKLGEAIERELSERRGQISRTYDTELDRAEEKLAEAQKARRRAKDKIVKERITEETSQLHAENRGIKGKIAEDLRSRGLPDYCNGRLFNILYFPNSAGDYAVLFLLQLLCYVALPALIALISGTTNLWVVVGIFAVDTLVFNALFYSTLKTMVYGNYDILSEAVERRAQIKDNAGKIDEITYEIRNDPSEENYDLSAYDEEISDIRQMIDKIEEDRQKALDAFDQETSTAITDELTQEAKPHMDELAAGIEEAALKVTELESQNRMKNQELAHDYEPYLGKKFMKGERIDALRDIINHGTAANITEAKEEYEHRMEG